MTSTLREDRTGAGDRACSPSPSHSHLDLLDDFRSQLAQLSATQRDLIEELRSDGSINLDAEELPQLRRENAELRARVAELQRLARHVPAGEDVWEERQNEYEKLLDE